MQFFSRFCAVAPRSKGTSWLALLAAGAALLTVPRPAAAQTFTGQTINGTAVIFGAGRTGNAAGSNFGGTAPPAFTLTAGTNRVLTFSSVTGTVTFNGGGNNNDADGVGSASDTVIDPFQGISGISFNANGAQPGRAGYLVGVFINGTPTGFADGSSGSNASNLSFDATTIGFSSAAPALNQTFFIGDGRTGDGTGAFQQFIAPDTASSLVLGFADAPGYHGTPGSYADNGGAFTASFTVTGAAGPEPNTFALTATTLVPLAGLMARRRRHRRNSDAKTTA